MKLEYFNEILEEFGLSKVDEKSENKINRTINDAFDEVVEFLGAEEEVNNVSIPLQTFNKMQDCPTPKIDKKNWCVIF